MWNSCTHIVFFLKLQKRHAKENIDSNDTAVDTYQVPVMDDILKDICDGCNLAILISFYCPHHLKFSGEFMSYN